MKEKKNPGENQDLLFIFNFDAETRWIRLHH